MKKQFLMGTLVAAMAGTAVPVLAQDVGEGFDVSANVGLVSDYLWRGVSQSNNQAAIQGGIDLKHSSGAYGGLWLSSVSAWYGDSTATFYASAEHDVYVGYGMSIAKDVAVDIRYTQFMYGNASTLNFDETHVAVSGFGATLGADYAGSNANGNSSTINYYGSYGYALPMDIGLSATYGVYDLKDDVTGKGDSDYSYWSVAVSKAFAGITFGLSFNDTNLSGSDCVGFTTNITNTLTDSHSACGEQFVLTATKAL